jgi:fumarate reductase flavoprotein subunit
VTDAQAKVDADLRIHGVQGDFDADQQHIEQRDGKTSAGALPKQQDQKHLKQEQHPLAAVDSDLLRAVNQRSQKLRNQEAQNVAGCENLAETVRTYDSYVAAGEDPVFHKQAELMQPIGEEDPFYLFEYNPSAFNTFGGCRTDHKTRALKPNFEVIPGLYIAGVENGSLYSSPYYDVGGTCNGLSLASGRLAGMEMAEYVKE